MLLPALIKVPLPVKERSAAVRTILAALEFKLPPVPIMIFADPTIDSVMPPLAVTVLLTVMAPALVDTDNAPLPKEIEFKVIAVAPPIVTEPPLEVALS